MKTHEIAEFLTGELFGNGDIEISGIANLEKASLGDIAFIEKSVNFPATKASCLIVPKDIARLRAETRPVESVSVIAVDNPKLAFALIAAKLHPFEIRYGHYHPTAVYPDTDDIQAGYIGAFVSIGENTQIGEGCQIHDGVRIGKNVVIRKFTIIHPNCVIYDNVEIGNGCIIHAGTVIGADGFGYVRDAEKYVKFPQIGTVVIEDDVEIGANSCVDRGALGETRIGQGTKIDNLVQVGHNVHIGKRCVIAAQTGISGSVVIEDDCVIGGQVGFGDHVRVLSGAVIGSQAGVLPGKIVRPGVWWGTPIQPLDEFKRQNAHVKGIARLKEEVREIKKKIQSISAKDPANGPDL
ncbi:MAG: UDP-3-O-(3-hydroxymyristoyl)glucosamine N-acyltransferase [Pyrinomonadaceae bacterium]|nr:UDP-3-O-(3-hydroxymyristoyl)glucosamine N-acyltransferase [Blastocatellia bacterium]MDQ3491179.1 UDP-3-O-(3-hydroxymyristoyl)glucosamine N-acyltransferase [Acidobacteriota bacterium]